MLLTLLILSLIQSSLSWTIISDGIIKINDVYTIAINVPNVNIYYDIVVINNYSLFCIYHEGIVDIICKTNAVHGTLNITKSPTNIVIFAPNSTISYVVAMYTSYKAIPDTSQCGAILNTLQIIPEQFQTVTMQSPEYSYNKLRYLNIANSRSRFEVLGASKDVIVGLMVLTAWIILLSVALYNDPQYKPWCISRLVF